MKKPKSLFKMSKIIVVNSCVMPHYLKLIIKNHEKIDFNFVADRPTYLAFQIKG